MKAFQIILSGLTAFLIVSGGAYTTVLVALAGQAVSPIALKMCIGLGVIAAAKDMRAVMNLPPLSNGNLEAIAQMVKMQPGNKPSPTNPKLFQATATSDGWIQASPKSPAAGQSGPPTS